MRESIVLTREVERGGVVVTESRTAEIDWVYGKPTPPTHVGQPAPTGNWKIISAEPMPDKTSSTEVVAALEAVYVDMQDAGWCKQQEILADAIGEVTGESKEVVVKRLDNLTSKEG